MCSWGGGRRKGVKTRSAWSETTYVFPGSQQHCDSHLHQHTHTHHHTHLHNLHTHLQYMVTAHPQLSEGVAYRNEREELQPIGQPGHETHTLERRERREGKRREENEGGYRTTCNH